MKKSVNDISELIEKGVMSLSSNNRLYIGTSGYLTAKNNGKRKKYNGFDNYNISFEEFLNLNPINFLEDFLIKKAQFAWMAGEIIDITNIKISIELEFYDPFGDKKYKTVEYFIINRGL